MKQKLQDAFHACGYSHLFPMQEKSLYTILSNQNVFLQAKTGSGKTLAYLLPVIEKTDETARTTQVLILCPTRELAMQVYEQATKLATYTKHHIILLIGGLDIRKQENALRHKPTILIGTPGRVADLLEQQKLQLQDVHTIVLDEVDQVISTGQRNETEQILSDYTKQLVSVSATSNEDVLSFFHSAYVTLQFDENVLNEQITAYYLETDHRRRSLKKLLRTLPVEQAIVFVNYKNDANEIALSLRNEGILAHAFSSFFDEPERIRILRDFKDGKIRVLVSTDAAARGLDLMDVSHIIHYHLPQDTATFIHRSGRSGHQGNTGTTIVLFTKQDMESDVGKEILQHCEHFQNTEKTTGTDLSKPLHKQTQSQPETTTLQIQAGRRDKLRPKDIIGALCTIFPFEEIGVLEIQESYTTVTILKQDPDFFMTLHHLSIKGKQRKIMIR